MHPLRTHHLKASVINKNGIHVKKLNVRVVLLFFGTARCIKVRLTAGFWTGRLLRTRHVEVETGRAGGLIGEILSKRSKYSFASRKTSPVVSVLVLVIFEDGILQGLFKGVDNMISNINYYLPFCFRWSHCGCWIITTCGFTTRIYWKISQCFSWISNRSSCNFQSGDRPAIFLLL